jgi:hypothetical protein
VLITIQELESWTVLAEWQFKFERDDIDELVIRTFDGDDDVLWSDALDEVYGGSGRDFFDLSREDYPWTNPRPGRYLDWGTV